MEEEFILAFPTSCDKKEGELASVTDSKPVQHLTIQSVYIPIYIPKLPRHAKRGMFVLGNAQ